MPPSSRPRARPARSAPATISRRSAGRRSSPSRRSSARPCSSNGYGEHNIQGIGDKHIPFIHNVMNTDVVIGVSDRSTDSLNLLFNSEVGKALSRAARAGSTRGWWHASTHSASRASPMCWPRSRRRSASRSAPMTPSSRWRRTVPRMYGSERRKFEAARYPQGFDEVHAGELAGRASRRHCRRPLDRARRERARSGSSISAITPGSSSRACRSRNSTGAGTRASGAGSGMRFPSGMRSSRNSTRKQASNRPGR